MIGLRQKLSLGFGGLLLIMLIIGIQGIIEFRNLGHSIDVILRENYQSVVACQEMKEALERTDSGMLFVLLGYSKEGNDLIRLNDERFAKALDIELNNITVPGEGEKAALLKELFARYRATLQSLLAEGLPNQLRQDRYFRELLPLFLRVKGTADEILRMNQDNMNEANEKARRQAAFAQERMYVFLLLGFLLAVTFMFFTGRWILRPINRLIRSTEEIRKGNLDLVVASDSHDEIGRLSAAFNDMAMGLREFRRTDQAKLIRTQRATQETLDNLSEAVAIVDLEGKVEIATDAARTIFGINAGALLRELPLSGLDELFGQVVQDNSPRKNDQKEKLLQRFVDGKERYFHIEAAPIRTRGGELTGVVLILKDVTEPLRLEEMKSDLISTVSHQLRTPLTSIRMAIHLLLEEKVGPLTEKQAELLLAARDESDMLHGILSSLLDMSRMKSGRLQMTFQEVLARGLVLDAVEPFLRKAREGGVELETDLPEDLPTVHTDRVWICHVFSNLLTNALNHTGPGGRITVAADADEATVRFRVADTGSGIPEQYLPRIFERFFRAPDQLPGTGAGLGLAIAKEIVEAHGGVINVESHEGKGTTFSFTLTRGDRPAARKV